VGIVAAYLSSMADSGRKSSTGGRRAAAIGAAPSAPKTDQEGQGLRWRFRLRPVEAVQTWLAATEISAGPVFRAVDRGGRVSETALVDASAACEAVRPPSRAGRRRLQRPQPTQRGS